MPDTIPVVERRTHLQLRAIFPAACEALRPFFDVDTQWEGQSHEHLAYRTLKEHFPELSTQERLHCGGHDPAALCQRQISCPALNHKAP